MFPNEILLQIMELLDEASALLTAATVRLYTNDYVPTGDTVLADLTEADYTGYAAIGTLTWQAAAIEEQGRARLTAASVQFVPTGSTITNTVYGWYLQGTSGGSPILLFAHRLPVPVSLIGPQTDLIVIPQVMLAQPHF